jgi:hypothetical protein
VLATWLTAHSPSLSALGSPYAVFGYYEQLDDLPNDPSHLFTDQLWDSDLACVTDFLKSLDDSSGADLIGNGYRQQYVCLQEVEMGSTSLERNVAPESQFSLSFSDEDLDQAHLNSLDDLQGLPHCYPARDAPLALPSQSRPKDKASNSSGRQRTARGRKLAIREWILEHGVYPKREDITELARAAGITVKSLQFAFRNFRARNLSTRTRKCSRNTC